MHARSVFFVLALACLNSPALARGPHPDAPGAATKAAPEQPFPTDVNWQLVELNGKKVPDALSIRLDSTFHSAGYSGCNTFSAILYPIRGQRLSMGPIVMTKKTCDPAHMALERTFLGTLHSGPSWNVVAGELVVKVGPNVLRFRRGI